MQKRRIRSFSWRKIVAGAACLLVMAAAAMGYSLYAALQTMQHPADTAGTAGYGSLHEAAAPAVSAEDHGIVHILLLGLDDGDPDYPGSPRRSDTMMVASLNPAARTLNLLSIPRDTRVIIPGRDGYDKINAAFFYGGPALAARTVSDSFHIPIDHYVVIDWQAFIQVVDLLGGVDLTVEKDMNYEDPYENLRIHLRKGYQHLNGKQAGEYVRFRHDELGDIGRVERQQKFLQSFSQRLFSAGTLWKWPSLINTLSRYVKTDMDAYTLIHLAGVLKECQDLQTATIPGDFATVDGLSYWAPNLDQTAKIVSSLSGQTRAE